MNKLVSLVIIFSCFLFAIDPQADKFELPDLFVTAKDLRVLDSSQKKDIKVDKDLRKKEWVEKSTDVFKGIYLKNSAQLLSDNADEMYNRVDFMLGLPSLLDVAFFHGYNVDKIPYFLKYRQYNHESIFGAKNTLTNLYISFMLQNQHVFDFDFNSINKDLNKANLLGLGYQGVIYNLPVTYQLQMLNTEVNPTALTLAENFNSNKLELAIPTVNLFDVLWEMRFKGDFLFSDNNQLNYFSIGFAKELFSQQEITFGAYSWSNKGKGRGGIFGSFNSAFFVDQNKFNYSLAMSSRLPSLADLHIHDFVEFDDRVVEAEQAFIAGVKTQDFFKQKEIMFMNLELYSDLNVWDDPDADNYYSLISEKDVSILRVGMEFEKVKVGSEEVAVRLQLPIYSKELPNRMEDILRVSYEKELPPGNLKVVGSYFSKEIGRRSAVNEYKEGYFDMDASYEGYFSSEWKWGIYLENFLSAGAEKYSGRKFSSPLFYGKVSILF